MLLTKDRAEVVSVLFDFAPATAIATATVEVGYAAGDGALVADGLAVVDVDKVVQRIAGGTPGRVYGVEALALLADGQERTLMATVRVT